jgi:hypothetical protein
MGGCCPDVLKPSGNTESFTGFGVGCGKAFESTRPGAMMIDKISVEFVSSYLG